MKKIFRNILLCYFLPVFILLGLIGLTSVESYSHAETTVSSYSASDWMPFNYVLSTGFGMSAKKKNIRTTLSYEDNMLTVSGNTATGGVGVTFLPEVNLDGFSIELELDNWRVNSPDKWLGISFMDKGLKTDAYNEVPVYAKHSETWANEYGAGVLMAWRPMPQTGVGAQPGVIRIQFNNIGIKHSFIEADIWGTTYNPGAGQYNDGILTWTGQVNFIQLCDTNWQPLQDYSSVKISIREITVNGRKGYAVDYNDGYYIRLEESINWPTKESNLSLFSMLDINGDDTLDEWEKDLFRRGSAWTDTTHGGTYRSHIQYANYGDPLYSLYNFEKMIKNSGGRLYLNVIYRDCLDMPEGENAQFKIKKINGVNPTQSETTSLTAPKEVTGKISATLHEENLYAGVYPSMVSGIVTDEAEIKNDTVASKINSQKNKLKVNKADKINFFGKTDDYGNVSIISPLKISYDLTGITNFSVYEVSGSDIKSVDVTTENNRAIFSIKDSATTYVLFYNDSSGRRGCGCGSYIGLFNVLWISPIILIFAVVNLSRKKKRQADL